MNHSLKISTAIVLAGGLALCAKSAVSASVSYNTTQAKVMSEYKGVKLGMTRDTVKAAMGNPESSSDEADDFKLTGEDTMRVRYENGEVKAIQLAFLDQKNAPLWKDVVGNAEVNEVANGKSARKVMEAEKFWVSIYQANDGSVTRITISK